MSRNNFCFFGDLEKKDIVIVVLVSPIIAGAIKLLEIITSAVL